VAIELSIQETVLLGILTNAMMSERTGRLKELFGFIYDDALDWFIHSDALSWFIYSGALLAWLGSTRCDLRRKLKHANNAAGRTLDASSASKAMNALDDRVGSTSTLLPPPSLAVWLLPPPPSPPPPPLLLLPVKSSARRCKKRDIAENNFHAANAETDKRKTQVVEGSHIWKGWWC
jgi:hypothetical protein